MTTRKYSSISWIIAGFALVALLPGWDSEVPHRRAKPPPNVTRLPYPGNAMLGYDELCDVTWMAKSIERMLATVKGARTEVLPQGLRDPDGSLGMILARSQPLELATSAHGMNESRAWVVLAVVAAVKYCWNGPVKVDYIGLTDARGLNGEGWFYRVNIKTARTVHREIVNGDITLEQGYQRLVAAWQRITPAE